MGKLWRWVETFNTAASVAIILGVPVSLFTAAGAAFWGHFEHLRVSYIVVLILAVFALTLWSWIGLVWLVDRAKPQNLAAKPQLDCLWGLAIDAAFLTFNPGGAMAVQITIQLRNVLSWPLKFHFIETSADVDGVIPNKRVNLSPPAVVMPGTSTVIAFDGYSPGTIIDKVQNKGRIDFKLKYGHPDYGYSREMARFYTFELELHQNPLQTMFLPLGNQSNPTTPPPVMGRFPVGLANSKEDEDWPIKDQ